MMMNHSRRLVDDDGACPPLRRSSAPPTARALRSSAPPPSLHHGNPAPSGFVNFERAPGFRTRGAAIAVAGGVRDRRRYGMGPGRDQARSTPTEAEDSGIIVPAHEQTEKA